MFKLSLSARRRKSYLRLSNAISSEIANSRPLRKARSRLRDDVLLRNTAGMNITRRLMRERGFFFSFFFFFFGVFGGKKGGVFFFFFFGKKSFEFVFISSNFIFSFFLFL